MEPIADSEPRRVLVTILEETAGPVLLIRTATQRGGHLDAALRAAGLLDDTSDLPADLEPLSDEARATRWARNPVGTPLS
jgi:hypothetical protein